MLVKYDHKFYYYFALSKSAEGVLFTKVQDLVEANPQLEGVIPPISIKVADKIWNVSTLFVEHCIS